MGIEIAGRERLHRRRAIVNQVIKLLEEYSTLAAGETSLPEVDCGRWDGPYGPGVTLVSAEPVVAEGFRSLLSASDLRLTAVCSSLPQAIEQLSPTRTDLLILHPSSASFLDGID